MIEPAPHRLRFAVALLCPEIEHRVRVNDRPRTERELWRELSCCLLSSQVSYGLADSAARMIDEEGLLMRPHVEPDAIEAALSRPIQVDSEPRRYRFPSSRAAQLSATHAAVVANASSLGALLKSFTDAEEARGWFVANAPGFGPKQASMFLRNAGFSYELAVLDRHVLAYMAALGLHESQDKLGSLARYHRCEARLVDHARELGYRVGLLDWAIWIVVRAARGMRTEAALA